MLEVLFAVLKCERKEKLKVDSIHHPKPQPTVNERSEYRRRR